MDPGSTYDRPHEGSIIDRPSCCTTYWLKFAYIIYVYIMHYAYVFGGAIRRIRIHIIRIHNALTYIKTLLLHTPRIGSSGGAAPRGRGGAGRGVPAGVLRGEADVRRPNGLPAGRGSIARRSEGIGFLFCGSLDYSLALLRVASL
jgi:hypothetical protein